jgi:FAD:protein FMN transferase
MNTEKTNVGAHHVEHVMGMPVSIDIRDNTPHANNAIADVVALLHDINMTWSTWRDDSTITRFARGEITASELPETMHRILDQCEQYSIETNGAFDIHIPAPNGTHLETSGYIKGWAIQQAAELLQSHSCHNFCINAGGDVVVRGTPEPGNTASRWQVGIRHPQHANQLCDVLARNGAWAIATSATYERGNHIIDPRTGQPATTVQSVTVLGTNMTEVDVAATTAFVMGTHGLDWLIERNLDAMIILNDNTVLTTPGFAQHRPQPVTPELKLEEQAC